MKHVPVFPTVSNVSGKTYFVFIACVTLVIDEVGWYAAYSCMRITPNILPFHRYNASNFKKYCIL